MSRTTSAFHWDIPAMEAGDVWYGTAVLGSSPATIGDIGSFPVTLRRVADDVTKTASVARPTPATPISYELTVQPNVTVEDRVYTITDTVPDGLTIDPASVTGGGVVDGQTITWEIEMPTPFGRSAPTCRPRRPPTPQCADMGRVRRPRRARHSPFRRCSTVTRVAVNAFATIGPFEQYGQEFPNLVVAEDGIVTVAGGYGGEPWEPQAIPERRHCPTA